MAGEAAVEVVVLAEEDQVEVGGDGALLYALLRFTIQYPHFGIPLIVGSCFILYQLKKAETGYRVTRTIRRGRKLQENDLRDDALESICDRDPQFTESLFLERVQAGFLKTQAAWSDQDLRSCRAFISDGVHERFDLYIQMQKTERIRNRMRNVEVTECEIVCVTSDPRPNHSISDQLQRRPENRQTSWRPNCFATDFIHRNLVILPSPRCADAPISIDPAGTMPQLRRTGRHR